MAKRYSVPNAFNPSTGAIDCSNIQNFDAALLLAVLNTASAARPNGVLYDPVTAGRGLTNVVGSTLYLELDTSPLFSGDPLLIIWDDGTAGGGGSGGGALSTSFATGTLTLTGSPQRFPNVVPTNGVLLIADQDNNPSGAYVGNSTVSTGSRKLSPGLDMSLAISNLNLVWAFGANGDRLYWVVT